MAGVGMMYDGRVLARVSSDRGAQDKRQGVFKVLKGRERVKRSFSALFRFWGQKWPTST